MSRKLISVRLTDDEWTTVAGILHAAEAGGRDHDGVADSHDDPKGNIADWVSVRRAIETISRAQVEGTT